MRQSSRTRNEASRYEVGKCEREQEREQEQKRKLAVYLTDTRDREGIRADHRRLRSVRSGFPERGYDSKGLPRYPVEATIRA